MTGDVGTMHVSASLKNRPLFGLELNTSSLEGSVPFSQCPILPCPDSGRVTGPRRGPSSVLVDNAGGDRANRGTPLSDGLGIFSERVCARVHPDLSSRVDAGIEAEMKRVSDP